LAKFTYLYETISLFFLFSVKNNFIQNQGQNFLWIIFIHRFSSLFDQDSRNSEASEIFNLFHYWSTNTSALPCSHPIATMIKSNYPYLPAI
jgi:hypothetical protein